MWLYTFGFPVPYNSDGDFAMSIVNVDSSNQSIWMSSQMKELEWSAFIT